MIGKTISHYKILEELGKGGMGVVYKAQDTKLDRTVALKFLPPDLTADPDAKQRFIHEARAASALDHPNICTIYEINEADDQLFIAMAYIEGQTLKDKIKAGPLGADEAAGIVLQVAEGLQEAHEHGIIHRDIKPANIMITPKGRAKIMDFGLAKSGGVPDLTQEGTTLGTVAYMSPEQTRGDEVDHRTDIWSLGVMFYEMATGRRPFRGDYEQAVVYSILNEDPEPPGDAHDEEAMGIDSILERCLKKAPAERYPAATDLIADLRAFSTGTTPFSSRTGLGAFETRAGRRGAWWTWIGVVAVLGAAAAIILPRVLSTTRDEPVAERKMLAVLPFENLGAPEDDYFADGITEEITARLAGIRELGVIARTSAMQYKDTGKVIPVIGQELGVGYILEGTIRWQHMADGPSRIRVTPQLIRVSDATHLWAHVYQMDISDIFQVQSDIAGKVAEALGITLLGLERQVVEARPTDNLKAYDYYLRAQDYANRSYGVDDQRTALALCNSAIEQDSTFAEAWALRSHTRSLMYWFDHERTPKAQDAARTSAIRALELAPGAPEPHLAMGYYYYWCLLDYDNALDEFGRARELQPNNAETLSAVAYVQRRQGRFEAALKNLEMSLDLDPLSWLRGYELAGTHMSLRQYEEAERHLDRAIALRPEWPFPYGWKALLNVRWTGDTAAARAVLKKIPGGLEMTGDLLSFLLFQLDSMDRDYEAALERLSSSTEETIENHYLVYPTSGLRGWMYDRLGKKDLAFTYYDSARVYLESRIESRPDDARLHSTLGLVYAGLGRKQDAVREGRLSLELLPLSKDASRAPYNLLHLAWIYTTVGEYDLAMDQLEHLLTIPAPISAAQIRAEPRWDPLRGHERFEKLIQD